MMTLIFLLAFCIGVQIVAGKDHALKLQMLLYFTLCLYWFDYHSHLLRFIKKVGGL